MKRVALLCFGLLACGPNGCLNQRGKFVKDIRRTDGGIEVQRCHLAYEDECQWERR